MKKSRQLKPEKTDFKSSPKISSKTFPQQEDRENFPVKTSPGFPQKKEASCFLAERQAFRSPKKAGPKSGLGRESQLLERRKPGKMQKIVKIDKKE